MKNQRKHLFKNTALPRVKLRLCDCDGGKGTCDIWKIWTDFPPSWWIVFSSSNIFLTIVHILTIACGLELETELGIGRLEICYTVLKFLIGHEEGSVGKSTWISSKQNIFTPEVGRIKALQRCPHRDARTCEQVPDLAKETSPTWLGNDLRRGTSPV